MPLCSRVVAVLTETRGVLERVCVEATDTMIRLRRRVEVDRSLLGWCLGECSLQVRLLDPVFAAVRLRSADPARRDCRLIQHLCHRARVCREVKKSPNLCI